MPARHRFPRHGFVARFAIASAASAVIAAGCGSPDRPPELADFPGPINDASADGAQRLFHSAAPVPLSCNLGPDGGVCACADQPLLGDPPNVYFVLDRSGSMAEDNKWPNIVSVVEKLVVALGPRVVVGVTVFPSPHFADSCAPGVEVFEPTRGDAPAGQIGPTETALIDVLGRIGPNGGTPTAATLNAIAPHLHALHGQTYVILATDGGPNCNAAATCDYSQCELNIENVAPGCPSAGPYNCCADTVYGDATSCLDGQPTIDAVKAIASGGIPVYVVGVPGSAPYATLLDQLAQAGGTAQRMEPNYFAVETADIAAFTSAIFGIAAKITATCTLTLDHPPADPTVVNVFLDEQVLPKSGPDGGGADGWALNGQTVTLLGQSCQRVLAGDVLDVRVVAGCPTLFR